MWSHDGKRLAYHGNGRDGVGYDIYVLDITPDAKPRLVVGAQKDNWRALDWSPDDQKLLVQRYVSINESYLSIVDAWERHRHAARHHGDARSGFKPRSSRPTAAAC